MDEHEKLLAQGPRVAPEPSLAESGFEAEALKPAADAESEPEFGFEAPKPVVASPTHGAGMSRRPAQPPWMRLIPLAGFALFLLASAAGYRRYAFVFLAAGFLLSVIARARRRRNL
jgi:hypothetical protein